MTYPYEIKDEFVDLRASGMTLSKAAKELGVARNTAMKWEEDLREKIEALKAVHLEELQEKYRISKDKRIEQFGKRYLAITEEIDKRDLSDTPTPKLFEMMIKIAKVLEEEIGEPVILSGLEIDRKKDERILANIRSIISQT